MLAIAMTLIAGAAAWGYVRMQAGSSENALQSNALATNDMLSEHFGVVDMYFGTNTSTTYWIYNTGTLTYQTFSVRLFGSGGLVNILYNYTDSGGTRTDYVYDLRSTQNGLCGTAASSYESPSLTGETVRTTNSGLYTLTIPSALSGCPSFGQTFVSGTTYTIVVTGVYGNSVTYSETA